MRRKVIYLFLAFMIAALAFTPSPTFAQEDGQDLEKELMALLEAGEIEAATQLLADMDQPDQEPPDEEIDTGSTEPVIIVDIEAVGSDINVALAWNPDMDAPQRAQLMIENARGEAINTVAARPQESSAVEEGEPPAEDEVKVVSVPGVLENIHEQGLQHHVVVLGDDGKELARYPYHVTLDCEDEKNCTYELMGGISTEAILITEELDRALDEVEADRPEDILAAVVKRYPHLQGDVYALAIQISIQEGVDPEVDSEIVPDRVRCICWWTAVVQRVPNSASFFSEPSPATSVYKAGWEGPGAAHYFAAKSVGGGIAHWTSGSTKLTMKIRCWGIIGWQIRVVVIHFPWGTITIKFYVPIFGYCPPQCDGKVTQNIRYLGHTTAETAGTAYAAAFDSAAYRVNGTMAPGFPQNTFSWAGPPGMTDSDFGYQSASVSTAQPSTAELSTFGAVGAWAESNSSACAKVVNGFIMSATATASCTIPKTVNSSTLGAHPSHTRYLWLDLRYNYLDRRVCNKQLQGQGDLGDAPDSTNHTGDKMTAYPGTAGRYPTVFDVTAPDAPGPKHWEPHQDAWLGEEVTDEYDADLLPDQDPTTNIIPPNDQANLDKADDGVHLNTVSIPQCGRTRFDYDVNVVGPLQTRYVNVWFDYNRDGDWHDRLRCETANGTVIEVLEWSVRNHIITVGPGYHTLTTPFFAGMDPPDPDNPMWMRITLSEAPAPVVRPVIATLTPIDDIAIVDPIPVATVTPVPTTNPLIAAVPVTVTRPFTIAPPFFFLADGRGPSSGYKYGETEDYYLRKSPKPGEICGTKWHDIDGDGVQDPGEPGLPGWTINVYDTAGNLLGTVITDAGGEYCFELSLGTYVVGEVQQAGWQQTFPAPPGTHTVNLGANQSIVNIDFGNRKIDIKIVCPENSIDIDARPDIIPDVKPDCDLGDAPDSSNHAGVNMLTYPSNVIARFPTVYDGPEPRGPRHFNVNERQRQAWLGRDVTCEHDADIGADCDGVNNISPPAPADQDKADDGVHLDTINIPKCGMTQLKYDVSNTISTELRVNIWFDFNRDGDWEDLLRCETEEGKILRVPEWAVQDQVIFVPGIIPTFTTPLFAAMDPPDRDDPMWMRITLSGREAPLNPATSRADGRGPVPGYKLGETEDYYLRGNKDPVCVAPPRDMKAWWTLDETSGMIAADRAAYPNDGTHMDGPTPSAGKVDGALTFDGIDDHIKVADHPDLNFGESDFTIDAWIRTSDAKGYRPIVDKRSSGAADAPFGYNFYLRDGLLGFNINTESAFGFGSSAGDIAPSPNLADGEWHFVAVTVERGSTTGGKLYVDGALIHTFNTTTLSGDADNTFPLIIASRNRFFGPPVDNFFDGQLDEIEIFHRDLTAAEILAIYEADRLGKCKEGGEIHGTKWEDRNGNGVRDRGEPGLKGWTIILTNAAGTSYSTTTDADGNYWFMDLPPGKYRVTEIIQNGWTQTFPAGGGHSIKLQDGEVLEGINFGNFGKSDESCHVGWDINVFNTNSNTIEVGMNISNQSGVDADYQLQVIGSPTMIVHGFTATTPFDPGQPAPTPPVFVPGNGNVYVAIFMSPLPTILGPSGQYQVIVTNPKTGHSFGCSAQLWQNEDVAIQPVDNVLIQELVPGQPMEIMFEVKNLGEKDMVPVMRVDQMFGAGGEELQALRVEMPQANRLVAEAAPLKAKDVVRVPVMVQLMEAAPNNAIGDVIAFIDIDGDGEPDAASSVIVRMVDDVVPSPLPILETVMGDVNCDDKVDSIDALLGLQFDVGLRDGAEECSTVGRNPSTLYLPVCDLNSDGDCGSVDALFLLQCDVGLPNFFCPEVNVLSNDAGEDTESRIDQEIDATSQQTSTLHLEHPEIEAGDTFTMAVMVDTGTVSLGTTSVRLNYDQTQFEATGCSKNESGASLKQCNTKHKDDEMVRFNFTVTEGESGEINLADIGFKHIGETVDMSDFSIDVLTFANVDGTDLSYTTGDTVVVGPVSTPNPEGPNKFYIHLPLVNR